jgi:hypothetical protein
MQKREMEDFILRCSNLRKNLLKEKSWK